MHLVKLLVILIFVGNLSIAVSADTQNILAKFNPLIEQGDITKAQTEMRKELATHLDLSSLDRLTLEFEIERLDRIRKDFTATRDQVEEYIKKYIPEINDHDLAGWENEKALEYQIIDGNKMYFNRAAANLFRIDQKAKQIKAEYEKIHEPAPKPKYIYEKDLEKIIAASKALNSRLVNPKRFRITYTLTVHADAVPAGEVIRAWLPYPREGNPRQVEVKFHYSIPARHIISDNDQYKQRTIYLEQIAKAGEATKFQCSFSFTSFAQYNAIDPAMVQAYDTSSLIYHQYTQERPPHIVFTDELRKVSHQIVGDETNPYIKAKKIFQWVDEHTPWASAREYSTIRNISMYAYENGHGDCGIQTLLFMTLARMNGIPVHWQSGYEMKPGQESMHDWCEMYLQPYGWVLVDQSYGIRNSDDEAVKWFCVGNTDAYRWIVNDDYSQPLYPAKIHPRSETVDFQRGEVEWRGGNLYFDQWDYDWQVEVME